jgi:TonB family protein
MSQPEGVGFDASAIEAVKQWRYKPAMQGNKPVTVYMTVLVEFALH